MKNRKGIALALAAGITLTSISMSGCGRKKYVLEGTLLAKAVVAKVDGNVAFVRPKNSGEEYIGSGKNATYLPAHNHYFDVVTGQTVTDFSQCERIGSTNDYMVLKVSKVEIVGDMLSYLTAEEMEFAMNGCLKNEDLVNIMYRIKEQSTEDQKQLVK